MNKNKKIVIGLLMFVFLFAFPMESLGKEKKKEFDIPSHVLSISKENTFPNSTEDQEVVEPSKSTKNLLDDLDIPVDNPVLIKLLNETTLKPSPISFGYRGMVFLGRWALNYDSSDTTVNWEYQEINKNELNNIGGDKDQVMSYNQENKKEVKGALTNKISNPDDIKNMILIKSKKKTKLPLSFQTVVGKNTKKDNTYNVPIKKQAILQATAPAVNEKGEVTFGEVYIQLKGTKKSLVIKNVTKQGIGAWIPIQDHVSFSFQLK